MIDCINPNSEQKAELVPSENPDSPGIEIIEDPEVVHQLEIEGENIQKEGAFASATVET